MTPRLGDAMKTLHPGRFQQPGELKPAGEGVVHLPPGADDTPNRVGVSLDVDDELDERRIDHGHIVAVGDEKGTAALPQSFVTISGAVCSERSLSGSHGKGRMASSEDDAAGLRWARRRGWSELLERQEALQLVRTGIAAVARGSGRGLVFEGPPGIGKSAVLHTAANLAAATSAVVLRASGSEGETSYSFAVVRQLFEPLLRGVGDAARAELWAGAAGLARPLLEPTGDDHGDQHGLIHGLFWLTCNIADTEWSARPRTGLVIVVDDLQWADDESQAFLLYLLQRLDELPVLLLLSARRAASATASLAQILAHPLITSFSLRPLTTDAVATLVRSSYFPGADDVFCAACAEVSEGNPFMLRALLAELDDEKVAPSAAAARLVHELVPSTVMRATIARLAHLSPSTTELAAAAAVLGDGAPLHQVAELAGIDVAASRSALDLLGAEELLRLEDGVRFGHGLVRAAILGDLSEGRRRRLHAEAARLLAANGEPLQRIVAQLLAAEGRADPWAVSVLREHARASLGQGSPMAAVRALRRAVEEPPPPDQRGELLAELGEAQLTAGDPSALETLEQAARLVVDPRRRVEVRRAIGLAHQAAGDHAAALSAFEAAAASLDCDDGLARELQLLIFTEASLLESANPAPALGDVHEVVSLEPSTLAERRSLAQLALQKALANRSAADVRRLAEAAWSNGRLLEETTASGVAWTLVTAAFTIIGDLRRVNEISSLALADAQRRGLILAFATACFIRGGATHRLGAIDDSIADLSQALDARRQGWGTYAAGAAAQLAMALVEKGRPSEAQAVLDEFGHAFTVPTAELTWLLLARGRVYLAEGRERQAAEDFHGAGELAQRIGIRAPGWVPWRPGAVLAHLRLGERDEAGRLASEAWELGGEAGTPLLVGRALRLRGLAEGGAPGAALLEQAVDTLASADDRIEWLRARVDLGAALRRLGKVREARSHLEAAMDVAQRSGAARLAGAARAELLAAGGRPRRDAVSGVGSLTPQEQRVARMAADGMSNPQIAQALFVTPRAIEWHLTKVFGKLHITSRAQLIEALGARGTTQAATDDG